MIVGVWRLVDFTITFTDGRPPMHPLGSRAQGRIIYTASGHVSATLARDTRAPLSTTRLEDAHRADLAEKAAAFDGYVSYAGRYRLEGQTVVHTVEMALLPNLVGAELRRDWRFEDGNLVLSYAVPARAPRTHTLAWAPA